VHAPIGSAATPELTAAVVNAGGLGVLALTWSSPDTVRRQVRRVRELTNAAHIVARIVGEATEAISAIGAARGE
jgi:NAD(P)H-dependent flavin oxidoreductase YrpB (nitropropane dioxygenase family)